MKENSSCSEIQTDSNSPCSSINQSETSGFKDCNSNHCEVKAVPSNKTDLSSLSVLTALLDTASNINSSARIESDNSLYNNTNRRYRDGNQNHLKNRYDYGQGNVNRNNDDSGRNSSTRYNTLYGSNTRWKSTGNNVFSQNPSQNHVNLKPEYKNEFNTNKRSNKLTHSNSSKNLTWPINPSCFSSSSNSSYTLVSDMNKKIESDSEVMVGGGTNSFQTNDNQSYSNQPCETEYNNVSTPSETMPESEIVSNEQNDTPTFKLWSQRHLNRSQNTPDQICRKMKSCLNKLTVENFPVVADTVCSLCKNIQDIKELITIVNMVLEKAFSEPEFSELYADLCLVMSYWTPSFNEDTEESSQDKNVSLSVLIIKKWVEEFNKLPESFSLSEEQQASLTFEYQEFELSKMKKKLKGLCVSFGEFLIRKIVSLRSFNTAAKVLIGDEKPKEHLVEGFCQILTAAGAFLDADPVSKLLLDHCFGKLQELVSSDKFSKRCRCLIQDLIDVRKVNWHRKIYREKATGLSKLKQEAENADFVGGSTVRAQYGFVVQLGQRSNIIDNVEYASYMRNQEKLYKERLNIT